MKKISLLISSIILFALPLFAHINVLSPIEGTWANKQMLVIENSGDGDYFYSMDGSDPDTFGFAYDGPVLLDLTGDVTINITYISKSGRKDKASIKYKVVLDDASDTNYRSFVQTFFQQGILNYSAGSKLSIPENLMYTLGLPPDSYLPGTDLSLSSQSVLLRYVPCTISDSAKNLKYRFIIKTYPQNAGIYSKREVPFTVTDWNTITFTNDNLLYRIDSEYWGLPTEPVTLDRSVSHTICWQNLDYEEGNTIEKFVLPPKPEIRQQKNVDGSFVYSISGDSAYTMSIYSPEQNNYMELFPEIGADVFYGDKASGTLDIGVFANSVYQGKIVTDYEIDKRPPVMPEIKSTAKSFYSRDKVHLEVSVAEGCDLYIALSEPAVISDADIVYTADSEQLKAISVGEYKKVKNGKFTINWGPRGSGPAYYKLSAYAKNGRNISRIAEYSIIIDQSSYYFDENADKTLAEGTAEHPFTDFSQCVKELKNVRAVTLRVKGNLRIEKKYELSSNYEIIDNGDACLTFGPEGAISLKGSSFEASGCRIQNEVNSRVQNLIALFTLENSVVTLKNCTIAAAFAKNGTVFDSYNSIINISDSVISVNAITYASLISTVKSRISVKKSTVSTSADTVVIFSASEGYITVSENSLSVSGQAGRIAELFGVKAKFTQNKFKGQLSVLSDTPSVLYANDKTTLIQEENDCYGF